VSSHLLIVDIVDVAENACRQFHRDSVHMACGRKLRQMTSMEASFPMFRCYIVAGMIFNIIKKKNHKKSLQRETVSSFQKGGNTISLALKAGSTESGNQKRIGQRKLPVQNTFYLHQELLKTFLTNMLLIITTTSVIREDMVPWSHLSIIININLLRKFYSI